MSAVFTIGQRVGILVGVQSVNGPHVGQLGTVVRTIYPWGSREYVVRTDDGQELVFSPFLLTADLRSEAQRTRDTLRADLGLNSDQLDYVVPMIVAAGGLRDVTA